ncbi:MAG: flagellar hook-length control protein FliK [Anaerolineae bacterium]|nr:flagellar hook-length control protein FliK [Anaerolineae bacterium]
MPAFPRDALAFQRGERELVPGHEAVALDALDEKEMPGVDGGIGRAVTQHIHYPQTADGPPMVEHTPAIAPHVEKAGPGMMIAHRYEVLTQLEELAGRIQIALRRGETEWRLQLRPRSLGRLEVHLTPTRAGLVLLMRTESPQAQVLIQANLDQLRSGLEGRGILLNRCEVVVGQAGANLSGLGGGAAGWTGPSWHSHPGADWMPHVPSGHIAEPEAEVRNPVSSAGLRRSSLIDIEV